MGWTQQIEYVDVEVTLPPPVKKQVWDAETQSFVPMTLYKRNGVPDQEKLDWLYKTYGPDGVYKNGRYWDYSRAGNFIVMDERVYTWFQTKWGNK
jgi:hypothetical protein